MARLIGFATEFYTLWNMEKEPQYIECNGSHHLVGYNYVYSYIQNISKDLETAKAKYPNLSVDEDLRGKTQSWVSENKEDLCPEIMKFGKYYGKDLTELVKSDFNYVLWVVENSYSSNQKFASELPEIKAYYQKIESDRTNAENEQQSILSELATMGTLSFIAEKNLSVSDTHATLYYNYKGVDIEFMFKGGYNVMSYNGFDYALPTINGKSKRIKGNEITLTFEQIKGEYDFIFIVKSILINK